MNPYQNLGCDMFLFQVAGEDLDTENTPNMANGPTWGNTGNTGMGNTGGNFVNTAALCS